ncbi:peroxiredoxin [Oscillatoria sp. CS-180]|uniref:peroxiredoxin n=1 Tax=Oscillatoria sp. CS-180 TaxID=3021720 RepID=UPI00232D372B|nr:peroxiredoxin [Oscillatoria sp. CS-180]MDB9529161.1 peroxiredoxin [Oscillatoria sp. CS-180]
MKLFRRSWLVRLCAWALILLSWGFVAPEAAALGGPQPPIGEAAPTFTLPTNSGDGDISLEDYRGRWVVLYFYPKDGTSGCTIEARRFQESLPEYQKLNAVILGVSVDDVDSHESFCAAEGIEFPLLSDTDGSVSKAYGSWLSGYSLRHTYLIDPNGVLQERFLGVRPAIHSREVLESLESFLMPAST